MFILPNELPSHMNNTLCILSLVIPLFQKFYEQKPGPFAEGTTIWYSILNI